MTERIPAVMRAVRLHPPGGPTRLVVEQTATPRPAAGEALVRVHAAAITRDELDGPPIGCPRTPPTSSPAWSPPSPAALRRGGRLVSVAEKPSAEDGRPRGGSPRSTSW
jgi:hypothetical protein